MAHVGVDNSTIGAAAHHAHAHHSTGGNLGGLGKTTSTTAVGGVGAGGLLEQGGAGRNSANALMARSSSHMALHHMNNAHINNQQQGHHRIGGESGSNSGNVRPLMHSYKKGALSQGSSLSQANGQVGVVGTIKSSANSASVHSNVGGLGIYIYV